MRRAAERYGLALTLADIGAIEDEILLGKWNSRRGATCDLHLVVRHGMMLPAVYDRELGAIVTILGDPDWWRG